MIKHNIFIPTIIVIGMLMCLAVGTVSAQYIDSVRKALEEKRKLTKIHKEHLRKMLRHEKLIFRRGGRNIRDIVFDFDKKVFINDVPVTRDTFKTPPFEIHEMDGIRINIKNVNPFIWSVDLFELQGDQISNEKLREDSQTSALRLNVPFFTSLDLSSFIVLASAEKDSAAYKNALEQQAVALTVYKARGQLMERKDSILAVIDTIQFEIKTRRWFDSRDTLSGQDIDNQTFKISRLRSKISAIDGSISRLTRRITNEALDSVSIAGKIKRASEDLSPNIRITRGNAVREKLTNEIRTLEDTLQEVNRYIFLHNQLVNIGKLSINRYETMDSCVTAFFNAAGVPDHRLFPLQYQKARHGVLRRCNRILHLVHQLKTVDSTAVDRLTAMESDVKRFCDSFKDFDHAKLVAQVAAIRSLVSRNNFELTYETLSIAENADFVKYKIEFEPSLPGDIPVSTGPFSLEMAFLVNEGLKVDVSTGLILDFNLADPKYYFSPFSKPDAGGNPVDSVTVTKSPDTGNVTPSINLMLNAYKRSSLNFKPGISVGFGVSNDIRFRLYAGPSLIIGRKERIMFSSGVAFGSILRHADGYDAGKKFAQNASLPAEVPMIQDKFQFGWYFGIGFNLSGKDTKGFVEKLKFN